MKKIIFKITVIIRLFVLSKSKYAMPTPSDNEKVRKAKYVVNKMINFFKITVMAFLGIVISSWLGKEICIFSNFSNVVNSENMGNYLGLFATHCSVVFLTTSLMTMLSEKSKFVYHIDLVKLVLINPAYYNFLALAVYAMLSILLAITGFILKEGFFVIGGFLFGIVAVMILFWRMVLIYYREEHHKNKIRNFLKKLIKLVRKIEDEKKMGKYRKPMRKIGYMIHFEEIVNQALNELQNNNIKAVIEAVELLESCIMWHVGATYDNDQKNIEKTFEIMLSDIGLKRSYSVKKRLDLEHTYIKFASVVAKQHPEELHRYYNDESNPISSEYLKMIRSTIFPYILNSYIDDGKKQQFFICLTKWDKLNRFFPAIKKYLVSVALDGKEKYLAEYYDMIAYSSAIDFETAQITNDIDSGIICWISHQSHGGAIFKKHKQILEDIYNESSEVFEYVLSYKNNRRHFIDVVSKNEEGEIKKDDESLKNYIYLSETALKNETPEMFHGLFQEWNRLMIAKEKRELSASLCLMVDYIIDLDNYSVRKTNADVEYLLNYIYEAICGPEFKCLMSFKCPYKSEKEMEMYFVELLNVFILALEEGMKKLERAKSRDGKNDPRNTVYRIEILQNLLDKAQAEKGEINGTKIDKSE